MKSSLNYFQIYKGTVLIIFNTFECYNVSFMSFGAFKEHHYFLRMNYFFLKIRNNFIIAHPKLVGRPGTDCSFYFMIIVVE